MDNNYRTCKIDAQIVKIMIKQKKTEVNGDKYKLYKCVSSVFTLIFSGHMHKRAANKRKRERER